MPGLTTASSSAATQSRRVESSSPLMQLTGTSSVKSSTVKKSLSVSAVDQIFASLENDFI
jgi:hypothetical protein